MSDTTGGVPPRDPQDPDERRAGEPAPDEPWQPPYQQGPADRQGPPAYGQYAPEGYTPPPPSGDPYGRPAYGRGPDEGPVRVGAAFSWAWSSFGRSAGPWIGATLVVLAIGLAASWLLTPSLRETFAALGDPTGLEAAATVELTLTDTLLGAVLSVVSTLLGAVLVHGALAATSRGTATFADFFALRNVPGILVLGLVNAVIDLVLAYVPVLGGMLQLVVSLFLVAAIFFVVHSGQDAITAIRSSATLVARNLGTVLVAVLLALALTFAGALLLGLGLLVAVPVTVLLGAYLFRRLVGEPVAPA